MHVICLFIYFDWSTLSTLFCSFTVEAWTCFKSVPKHFFGTVNDTFKKFILQWFFSFIWKYNYFWCIEFGSCELAKLTYSGIFFFFPRRFLRILSTQSCHWWIQAVLLLPSNCFCLFFFLPVTVAINAMLNVCIFSLKEL